jgi:hypothetical protein
MATVGLDHIAAIRKRQKLVTLFAAFRARPGDEFCDFHGWGDAPMIART